MQREQILNHVWGYNSEVETNVADVYIKYLRNKLKPYDREQNDRNSSWRRVCDTMTKRKLRNNWIIVTTMITFVTIFLFCLIIIFF